MANKTAAQLIAAARKRPLAPEKLQAVMLKIRKGATASLTISQIVNVIDAIGWKIEPMVGWVPMHYMHDGEMHLEQIYAPGGIEAIKHDHERSKKSEVKMLPPKAVVGQHVVMEVSEIKEGYKGYLFHQKEWVGAEGFRIATNDGKIIEHLPGRYDLAKPLDYGRYDIVRALNKAGWDTAVNAALNMEAHKPAEPRSRENTGTCGWCWGNYKLDNGRLVLHGYQRPGWGHVHGRCRCVNYQPLELSPATAVAYREALDEWIGERQSFLNKVAAGEVAEVAIGHGGRNAQWLKKGEPGFERHLKIHVDRAKSDIDEMNRTAATYDKIIAKWRVRPMPKDGELLRGPGFFTK